jgi:hypothetical protein
MCGAARAGEAGISRKNAEKVGTRAGETKSSGGALMLLVCKYPDTLARLDALVVR